MIIRRGAGLLALALGAAQGGFTLTAAPALAHGATAGPVSRAVECGPEGGGARRSAACVAAIRASGAGAADQWDNIRVPGVNGRDRQVIPDGRLCSGGVAAFHGLDLARTDWPATRLTAGERFSFAYRTTIPHRGSFRLYVTRDSYRPAAPLRWSDVQERPFLDVKDPPVRNGAFVFSGRLPQAGPGRHVILTIWQTSDTPDTYYSCSDVDFTGGSAPGAAGSAGAAGGGKGTGGHAATATPGSDGAGTSATPAPTAGEQGGAPAASAARTTPAGAVGSPGRPGHGLSLPLAAGAAGLLAVLAAGGGALWLRRRRLRPGAPAEGA